MKTAYLKIKLKSLAAEAAIIKQAEQKLEHYKITGPAAQRIMNKWTEKRRQKVEKVAAKSRAKTFYISEYHYDQETRYGLREHRVHVVRKEARHSHLAYGFLRGTPYKVMENTAYIAPDFEKVFRVITSFSLIDKRILAQKFQQWIDEAGAKWTPKNEWKEDPFELAMKVNLAAQAISLGKNVLDCFK